MNKLNNTYYMKRLIGSESVSEYIHRLNQMVMFNLHSISYHRDLILNQVISPLDLSDLQKAFEIYQSRKIENKGADSTFVV